VRQIESHNVTTFAIHHLGYDESQGHLAKPRIRLIYILSAVNPSLKGQTYLRKSKRIFKGSKKKIEPARIRLFFQVLSDQ
jgi:hypothetical protein